jgi:hypothetical protein
MIQKVPPLLSLVLQGAQQQDRCIPNFGEPLLQGALHHKPETSSPITVNTNILGFSLLAMCHKGGINQIEKDLPQLWIVSMLETEHPSITLAK